MGLINWCLEDIHRFVINIPDLPFPRGMVGGAASRFVFRPTEWKSAMCTGKLDWLTQMA